MCLSCINVEQHTRQTERREDKQPNEHCIGKGKVHNCAGDTQASKLILKNGKIKCCTLPNLFQALWQHAAFHGALVHGDLASVTSDTSQRVRCIPR
jgi:hypothetical protein